VCVFVVSAVQDPGLVEPVHLLQEDEGEHGVRPEPGVVRREAFPQGEEALVPHHAQQHLLEGRAEGICVYIYTSIRILYTSTCVVHEAHSPNRFYTPVSRRSSSCSGSWRQGQVKPGPRGTEVSPGPGGLTRPWWSHPALVVSPGPGGLTWS